MQETDPVVQTEGGVAHAVGLADSQVGEDLADEAGILPAHSGFVVYWITLVVAILVPFRIGVLRRCCGGPSRRRIELLRAPWVTSARPNVSSSGGRYIPKRPR